MVVFAWRESFPDAPSTMFCEFYGVLLKTPPYKATQCIGFGTQTGSILAFLAPLVAVMRASATAFWRAGIKAPWNGPPCREF